MERKGRWAAALAAVALATTAGCGGSDGSSDADRQRECQSLLRQAEYSVLKQLVEAGQLAKPEQVVAAAPDVVRKNADGTYELPSYEAFKALDDGTQATVLSSVSSRMNGVGEVFDSQVFARELNQSGECKGALS